jgi:hypothetical protein
VTRCVILLDDCGHTTRTGRTVLTDTDIVEIPVLMEVETMSMATLDGSVGGTRRLRETWEKRLYRVREFRGRRASLWFAIHDSCGEGTGAVVDFLIKEYEKHNDD